MYYAQQELRLRVDGINRFREAFQAVHAGDKDIVQAAIFQFRQYIQPELYHSLSKLEHVCAIALEH
jgi:hypothetical protein